MNYNGFGAAARIGDEGENAITTLLEKNGFYCEDRSSEKQYDILATKGEKSFHIEVKTDTAADRTGNLVIELISNKQLGVKGWFYTSIADKFFFYLKNTHEYIVVDGDELRQNAKKMFGRFIRTEQWDYGNEWKEGLIALLPISQLELLPSYRRGHIYG